MSSSHWVRPAPMCRAASIPTTTAWHQRLTSSPNKSTPALGPSLHLSTPQYRSLVGVPLILLRQTYHSVLLQLWMPERRSVNLCRLIVHINHLILLTIWNRHFMKPSYFHHHSHIMLSLPSVDGVRLATLEGLPRIAIVAAAAFFWSPTFRVQRPHYKEISPGTL
jgi:hypothetical protein